MNCLTKDNRDVDEEEDDIDKVALAIEDRHCELSCEVNCSRQK